MSTTSAPGVAIEARGLHRFFHAGDEEVQALRGVSLSVARGEMVAVTGPSGSGKSTLLRCLAGLDEPDGGTVFVAGERLTRRPEAERDRLRARYIGLLFQSANLIEHLTVAQNVFVAQQLAGRADRRRALALLDRLGLAGRARARPGQLSGGELARAGLAVAVANDPEVVLADEPTGELDAAAEAAVLDLLAEHASHGAAVIVAGHSPAVAQTADRSLRLTDGAAQ